MTWVLKNQKDVSIINEISSQSDRGAIIVAAAFLEDRLEETIKFRLDANAPEKLLQSFFDVDGPASSLSAKINLAALLQIYPESVRNLFHKIRKLRNDAAHATSVISFEAPSIRSRCDEVQSTIMNVAEDSMNHNMNLIRALRLIPTGPLPSVLLDDGTVTEGLSLGLDTGTPKSNFLLAVKFLLSVLYDAEVFFRPLQIVIPSMPGRTQT